MDDEEEVEPPQWAMLLARLMVGRCGLTLSNPC